MKRWKSVVAWAGLSATIATPFAGIAQGTGPAWRSVTTERLLNPEPGDWASYRRTMDVTGFSPLDQITTANVDQLRMVWSYSVPDNSRWPETPLVVNGIMYVSSGLGKVIAFDAATGDVLWMHERTYPKDISISQAYGRSRGVAVYGDLVYFGTADAHLMALDARSGKVVWDVVTGDYHTGEGHNHPPLVIDGKVFIGHSGGDRTARGRFRAYDAQTGKLLWTINTAPQKGDPGYETWPKSGLEPMGAVPWNTVSYDAKLGLVYFGTGQPTPWSESTRGHDKALYTNSILAVEANTGKIRWYHQVVPNDNWDRDSVYENMLVDLQIGGRMRKALIQTGKIGWGVIFDRETGEFLGSFRTAYESVITGWTKKGDPISDPKFTITAADIGSNKVFEVCPHIHGARNLNAASFSPQTGLYYLGVNNTCMSSKITAVAYEEGQPMTGTSGPAHLVPGYDYVGEFVAFDPVSGQRRWTYRPPGGAAMSASALATAGSLVFGGTVDRQFFALGAQDGKLLWQTRLNGDVSGAPISFAVDGRQYLAITAGGRPGPTTSFADLTHTVLPQGSGMVYVFALPDKRDLSPFPHAGKAAVFTTSDAPIVPGSDAAAKKMAALGPGHFTETQAERGRIVFQRNCVSCHAVVDQTGPAFRAKWARGSLAPLFNFISAAMPEKAPGSLSKAQYADVIAFIVQQSGYAPGTQELPADATALEKLPFGSASKPATPR